MIRAAVYEWWAWEGFLLPKVLPGCLRIPARIGEDAERVLERLPAETDLFVFHLNLTVTGRFPRRRRRLVGALAHRKTRPLNAAVTDTTRRAIQDRCARLGLATPRATPHGDPDELMIVKTDYNYGGQSERRLRPAEREQLGIAPPSATVRGPSDYRVLPRRAVPYETWSDPSVVVERYVRNRYGVTYRLYLLGDRLSVSEVSCPDLINRLAPGLDRRTAHVTLETPPEALAERHGFPGEVLRQAVPFIRSIGLDFGTLDVLRDDSDRCYVVDVNPTPYWGNEVHGDILEHLRPREPASVRGDA